MPYTAPKPLSPYSAPLLIPQAHASASMSKSPRNPPWPVVSCRHRLSSGRLCCHLWLRFHPVLHLWRCFTLTQAKREPPPGRRPARRWPRRCGGYWGCVRCYERPCERRPRLSLHRPLCPDNLLVLLLLVSVLILIVRLLPRRPRVAGHVLQACLRRLEHPEETAVPPAAIHLHPVFVQGEIAPDHNPCAVPTLGSHIQQCFYSSHVEVENILYRLLKN